VTEKLLLTPEEAAERLAISRTQLYALIKAKRIRSVKIGKARRISVAALEDFVAQSEASEVEA
jgi:excisionase family DNA binding protein